MWYAIISEDFENSLPLRRVHREAHLARLTELERVGRLLLAGPHPVEDCEDFTSAGISGSLIVAQFDSLQEAQAWAGQDPYVLNNIHSNVVVKPFLKVLPLAIGL